VCLQVKQQHLERNVAFLVDELKVVQGHEAPNRVFFVSAREALVSRVNQDKGTPTPSGQLLEGFQGRIFEFANFERKFEVSTYNKFCDCCKIFDYNMLPVYCCLI